MTARLTSCANARVIAERCFANPDLRAVVLARYGANPDRSNVFCAWVSGVTQAVKVLSRW
ncbi:hypothetical protein [Actinokineospora inagensis]|uniref:hypothetical protein n=1 Tax=Actinokineospora inagensis TaxID=103730 RepID=UPI0005525BD1|nr:hypothetical protein [Actinokineospora inagensis]